MFAVFGINETKARQMAIKKTPKTTGKGKQQRALTAEEYEAALAENTARYLQQMKPVILSPEYSTPETCHQFIQMAMQGGATRCAVMIKAPVERKTKTGRTKIGKSWMPYDSSKQYSISNQLF